MKMPHYCAIAGLILVTFVPSYSQTPQPPCVQIKEKCKLNLKQTKWGFKLGGIDFKSGPVTKIGEVSLGTDLIQQMTPLAQLLDQLQLSNCQLRAATTTCDSVRQKIIILQAVTNAQLFNLAILAQAYSGNAAELRETMLKWVAQSADLLQKIASNQFMSTNEQNRSIAETANRAMSFALGQLSISPGSPELQRLLAEDLLRDRISR